MRLFHQNKNDWFLLDWTIPKTKFCLTSATIKSNVNRISFTVRLNSWVLGRFHFESHVNTVKKTELAAPDVLLLSKVSTLHYQNGKNLLVLKSNYVYCEPPMSLLWCIKTEQMFTIYSQNS